MRLTNKFLRRHAFVYTLSGILLATSFWIFPPVGVIAAIGAYYLICKRYPTGGSDGH